MIHLSRLCLFSCLLAQFGLAPAHAQQVIDLTKPVSESVKPDGIYWAFDGGTIDDWMPDPVIDGSGNAFHGLLQSGEKKPQPTYVEGRFGTAIRFEGNTPAEETSNGTRTFPNPRVTWTQYDRPMAPDPTLLDMVGTSFTGGAWIKFEDINAGQPQQVTLFHRGRGNGFAFSLVKDASDDWILIYAGGGHARSAKAFEFNDLQWHHVAFTYEFRPEGNRLQFWVDGRPLGHPVALDGAITEPPPGNRIFSVGESNVGSFGTGFVGAIDDVFVTRGAYEFR